MEKREAGKKQGKRRHLAPKVKKKGKLCTVLFVICLLVFLGSGGYLLNELVIIPYRSRASIGDFQNIYHSEEEKTSSGQMTGENHILDKFVPLLEMNEDTVGWLTIPNTSVDFPVFYKPDGNNFYLKRDAHKNSNKLGSLYIGDNCSMDPMSDVLVMYGHNMEDNDEMFGQLMKFKSIDFLKENPVFTFDTLYEESQWKILAVIRASTNDLDKNEYVYWQSDYESDEDFMKFVQESRVRSMYNIEDDTNPEDQLLVFSTCDYAFWGDRLVIVSRKLREGETEAQVRNSRIEKNPAAKYSQLYYDFYGGEAPSQQEIEENYRSFYGTEDSE